MWRPVLTLVWWGLLARDLLRPVAVPAPDLETAVVIAATRVLFWLIGAGLLVITYRWWQKRPSSP